MPRTRLYNTKEERLAAHRRDCKKSYQIHKAEKSEIYKLRAMRRYYTKKYEASHDQTIKEKLDKILDDLAQCTTNKKQL